MQEGLREVVQLRVALGALRVLVQVVEQCGAAQLARRRLGADACIGDTSSEAALCLVQAPAGTRQLPRRVWAKH